MENKKNILDELEKEAPFLSKIKKENHFYTPKNYFESLPDIITYKKLDNKSLNNIFDKLSYHFWAPITAVIVLSFIVFNFESADISTEFTPSQLSELIIDEGYFEMDDYLIYEAYEELLAEEEKEATAAYNDEYIDYLIENDIDINSIIEEL